MAQKSFNARHGMSVGTAPIDVIDASGNATFGSISGTLTGNSSSATYANAVSLTADNTTDATNYLLFANATTGNLSPRTDTGLTYNPFTGLLSSTSFAGAFSGNATTATTLAAGRTIAMTGDVSWTSTSFDGSGNVTGTSTIGNNVVTLAKLAQMTGPSLLGRLSDLGNVEALTPTNAKLALAISKEDVAGLKTSSSPAFAGLSLSVTPLAISSGGTGAGSVAGALSNLLPGGATSGYVLKTAGPGSYYWGAETGASTIVGTRINTSRMFHTATSGQTLFASPTYLIGSNQVRVYINGVRQFNSEYAETSTTSVTLNALGATLGDSVMVEVDGYIEYDTSANAVTVTPVGGISATDVQSALSELDIEKAPLASPTFTGTPSLPTGTTGVTQIVGNNTAALATTAFVLANGTPLSDGTPLVNGTAAAGSGTTASRYNHVHPTDTSRAATGQTFYIGTTQVAINRASAALTLNGVNVSGSSGSCTGNAASATYATSAGSAGTATNVTNVPVPASVLDVGSILRVYNYTDNNYASQSVVAGSNLRAGVRGSVGRLEALGYPFFSLDTLTGNGFTGNSEIYGAYQGTTLSGTWRLLFSVSKREYLKGVEYVYPVLAQRIA